MASWRSLGERASETPSTGPVQREFTDAFMAGAYIPLVGAKHWTRDW